MSIIWGVNFNTVNQSFFISLEFSGICRCMKSIEVRQLTFSFIVRSVATIFMRDVRRCYILWSVANYVFFHCVRSGCDTILFFSCFPISFKCWTFLHETRSSTAAKMVFARRMLIRANVGTFPIRSSPHREPSGKNTMVEHCINRRCVCLLCVRKVLPKSNYISHSPTLP